MADKVTVQKTLMEYRGVMMALNTLRQTKMSARLAYAVNSVRKAVQGILEPFDEAVKQLGEKYDAKFTSDSGFEIPDSEEFREEFKELAETKREIEVYGIDLPPDIEFDGAGEVLDILDGIVSVKGVKPQPKRPIDPETGKPMDDGKWAQKVVDAGE